MERREGHGRMEAEAGVMQPKAKKPWSHKKLEKASILEGTQLCACLDFGLPAFRTMTE